MPSPFTYSLLPTSVFDDGGFDEPKTPKSRSFYRSRSPASRTVFDKITPRSLARRCLHFFISLSLCFIGLVLSILLVTALFFPSYSNLPAHYTGTNPRGEKVFIAANIIDEDLIRGAWGQAVLDLVDVLGHDNVFVSVYENDSGPSVTAALKDFEGKLPCNSSVVSEHLPLEDLPSMTLDSGETRVRRIAYLAEVRNRALRPLDRELASVRFDKILFINDVVFSPKEAANLLFGTNVDERGRAQYRAACAMDFIDPVKYYDTWAARDLEGYELGVPFYPWFSSAGRAESQQDVLMQKDAVRVRSCWGGMVAFDAQFFQDQSYLSDSSDLTLRAPTARQVADVAMNVSRPSSSPLRFRSEVETYWESSECCLLQADLQYPRELHHLHTDTGIYMNPYVRVAYSPSVFRFLSLMRRFERVYHPVHIIADWIANKPGSPPRRADLLGEQVTRTQWVSDGEVLQDKSDTLVAHGAYESVTAIADNAGFCGGRQLLLMKPDAAPGEKNWVHFPAPKLPQNLS